MYVRGFHCDAAGCKTYKLDEDEMITATVTIKASPGFMGVRLKLHACCIDHLGEAVKQHAEV